MFGAKNLGFWFSESLEIKETQGVGFQEFYRSKNILFWIFENIGNQKIMFVSQNLKKLMNFMILPTKLFDQLWLEWPSTQQCTIQKIPFLDFMDGMKLSPRGQFTWSVVLIFFWAFFFLTLFSSQLAVFSFGPPLTPYYIFWQLLPSPPTHLLPCLPPPASFYLIPSFSAHLHT